MRAGGRCGGGGRSEGQEGYQTSDFSSACLG